MTKLSSLEPNTKMIGKVVDFYFGNHSDKTRFYGKIDGYLPEYDTFLIKIHLNMVQENL